MKAMRFVAPLAVLFWLWSGGVTGAGKLYKWTDANGQTHYSQTPPPDQSIDFRASDVQADVREELRPYCSVLRRFATEVHLALQRGASLESVLSISRGAEDQHLGGAINQGQLREVANYVDRARLTRGSAAETAQRVEDSCMRGTYGKIVPSAGQQAGTPTGRSGTGWFAARGVVATSLHVVEGKRALSVILAGGERLDAEVIEKDARRDLAMLRVSGANHVEPLPVAGADARLGAKVFTLGFPHTSVMGITPKLTDGVISAQSGMSDDPDSYQISVPVQSGNSGGPLVTDDGLVVGVVSAKLNAGAMYEVTRDVTQNVNYAVKSRFVRELAATSDVPLAGGASREDLIERVQQSVVRVIAE